MLMLNGNYWIDKADALCFLLLLFPHWLGLCIYIWHSFRHYSVNQINERSKRKSSLENCIRKILSKMCYCSAWTLTSLCLSWERIPWNAAAVEPNENPGYLYHDRHSLPRPWCQPTSECGECLPLSSRTFFRHPRIIVTGPMERHIYQGIAADCWFSFFAVNVYQNGMTVILKSEVILV